MQNAIHRYGWALGSNRVCALLGMGHVSYYSMWKPEWHAVAGKTPLSREKLCAFYYTPISFS